MGRQAGEQVWNQNCYYSNQYQIIVTNRLDKLTWINVANWVCNTFSGSTAESANKAFNV